MQKENEIARWHVYFSGDVQGVGFRYTARLYARDLKLSGWVMNLPDGRVEMEVQGPEEKIQNLIVSLKSSPPIRITGFEIRKLPPREGEFDFRVSYY